MSELTKNQAVPETAKRLIRLIGTDATAVLIEAAGGTTLSIKAKKKAGNALYEALAEIVGYEAADAITKEYAGKALYIPNCKAAINDHRNRAIQTRFNELLMQGYSRAGAIGMIAAETRLSDRSIREIVKEQTA